MRRYYHVDLDELEELWRNGLTVLEIARHFRVSMSQVWRLRKQCGLSDRGPPEPFAAPTPEDDAASGDSLQLSPWVAARIKELGLGVSA